MTLVQFPGPGEEGLKFLRETMDNYPYGVPAWRGPFFPVLDVRHGKLAKDILNTSGTLFIVSNLLKFCIYMNIGNTE